MREYSASLLALKGLSALRTAASQHGKPCCSALAAHRRSESAAALRYLCRDTAVPG